MGRLSSFSSPLAQGTQHAPPPPQNRIHVSSKRSICKALQLHPPGISDIPHKSLVAQRLSQCLNPALPAGVHQEALRVYTYIFSLIGVGPVNLGYT